MADQYYQCKMRMVRMPGRYTTGWIEARGAKVGAKIEILPDKEWWEVVEVYKNGMPEDVLKRHKLANRRSLPSIEAIS